MCEGGVDHGRAAGLRAEGDWASRPGSEEGGGGGCFVFITKVSRE